VLAEAAAQGMGPADIVAHCRAAIAAFAFPNPAEDAAQEGQA
jgi:hypothetical protein